MSKRARLTKYSVALPRAVDGWLGGLPCELWLLIWPHCGKRQGLVVVSKAWLALAQAAVRVISYGQTRFNDRMRALTKEAWARFKGLERLCIDRDAMRLASVIPALERLPRLHTLRLNAPISAVDQLRALGRLTQLTALELRGFNTARALLPYTEALTQMRLLRVEYFTERDRITHLTALTCLDLARRGSVDSAQLQPLTALQYLHLNNATITSYAPFAALTALAILELNDCRAMDRSEVSLRTLTSLTALSVVDTLIRVSEITTATQLRWLCMGETRAAPDQWFGAGTLDVVPLRQFLPAVRLVYGGCIFANNVPTVVTRHALERDTEDPLLAFEGWSHPLPPRYFGNYDFRFIPRKRDT